MEHLEVVSFDGAVREESHRGIGLHKEEEEEGVHCVYMYVCMYINIGTLCAINDTTWE